MDNELGDEARRALERARDKEKEKQKDKEKKKHDGGEVHVSMMDIHPVEIARQLTLHSDALFRAITPDEFMKSAFSSDRRDAHLVAFSRRYGQASPAHISRVGRH